MVAILEFGEEIDRGLIRLVASREPQRLLVVGDQIRSARQILDVAVFFRVITRQPQCKLVAGRDIDGAFEDEDAALSDVELSIPACLIEIRLCRDDIHRAADRVPSEQEALRTTEDLRTLDVIKTGHHGSCAALVQSVLVKTDRRVAAITEIDRPNTSDTDEVDKAVFAVTADAWSESDQVLDIIQVDISNELARHGRDGKRHVHYRFCAFRRRHDDFLEWGVLCQQWPRCNACDQRDGNGLRQYRSLGFTERAFVECLGDNCRFFELRFLGCHDVPQQCSMVRR